MTEPIDLDAMERRPGLTNMMPADKRLSVLLPDLLDALKILRELRELALPPRPGDGRNPNWTRTALHDAVLRLTGGGS